MREAKHPGVHCPLNTNAPAPLVSFSVRAVYLPRVEDLLLALHGDDILQGRILDYSDGGTNGPTFAVVGVPGLAQPVIVPVEKLNHDRE